MIGRSRLTGATVATIGGGLLGVAGLRDQIPYVQLPTWSVTGAAAIGTMLIIGGALTFVYGGLDAAWQILKAWLTGRESHRFECLPAKARDLETLRSFYTAYFGTEVPSLATMQLWHQRNPRTFWLLSKVTSRGPHRVTRTLVGSFKVCAIHADYIHLLDQERVTGANIPVDAITSIQEAAALYVGDVAAKGKTARAALLAYLDTRAGTARARGLPIYARPLTPDGLKLIRGHRFQPVSGARFEDPIGHIFRLDADRKPSKPVSRGSRLKRQLRDA